MKLTHNILIDDKTALKNIISVEIRKSVEQLSDIAFVKISARGGNRVLELPKGIKRGSNISISLGYDGQNNNEFKGFVTQIKHDKEIELVCEDGAFNLRKEIESKEYKKTKVGDVIADVVEQAGMKAEISDNLKPLMYDKFTIKDATAYEVLEKVKEEFSIHIYVRNSVVYASLKYELDEGLVRYDFSKNVEKSSLKWEQEEYKKTQVEVVGIDKKNKKVSVIVGEKGGDRVKINRYNVMDEDTLRVIGEEELKKWSFTGYKGEIDTWLVPYVSYGYSAELTDVDYLDRKGRYYVEAVTTKYSERGGNRQVNLGIKLS